MRTRLIYNILILVFFLINLSLGPAPCFSQEDIEFNLDVNAPTVGLPKLFKPGIDLSGRGFHRDIAWPQTLSSEEVLKKWEKDVGFANLYRLQYNLWEINQAARDKELYAKLLANYENIIKKISDSGGVVIVDIFGTPAGLGKVLDKKSPPAEMRAFKEEVKKAIRDLSCNKKYNIWYEVWNAPDLDNFFLGRKQEYLLLYRAVAEAVKELEAETKMHIPLGGPSVSWWFQNLDGNTILSPERSLIYELIKFCYRYHLPLDFITWHGYSTDPDTEKENTFYKKTAVELVHDWLTYFNFKRDTPLIVDEWNYDRDLNVLAERQEKSFIAASYIPSRLKNMYEAGMDYQIYFCLEDFQNNKEGVVRNVGIFSFDAEYSTYKGGPKSIYNVFRMLSCLGKDMFLERIDDLFAGAIATRGQDDSIALLVYNYVDPDIAKNYLSKNLARLSASERKALLNIINSDRLNKVLLRETEVSGLRVTNKIKELLGKAQELNDSAKRAAENARNIKITVKNLKDNYLYEKYTVGRGCSFNCEFEPVEKKEINGPQGYGETLALEPYSVVLLVLKRKPQAQEAINTAADKELPADTSPKEEKVLSQTKDAGDNPEQKK